MSSEQLATRLLSEVSRIPSEKIRTGNLSKFDFENMMKGSEKIKDLNLFIDDSPALTLSQ